tara:strand:+ start:36 stop:296 length:261 start_codon:yes stop_codon:yes gene_type:complete
MKTFTQFAKKAGKFFFGPKALAVGTVIDAIDGKPFADGTLTGADKTFDKFLNQQSRHFARKDARQTGVFTRSAAKKFNDMRRKNNP